jgi:putative hydrolase of the HAD superfamily
MIKLFIFDLGKVLVDFDFSIAIERLQKRTPINPLKIYSLFRNSDLAHHWDKGLISEEVFFQTIQSELQLPLKLEEFKSIWNEIFTEKKEMVELSCSIAKKNKTVILSNTNIWHAEYLKSHYSWMNQFDAFIASCDVQLLKPDPAIYHLVLKKYGVSPSEAVYIDDVAEFVSAAKKIGIQGWVYENCSQIVTQLKNASIPL